MNTHLFTIITDWYWPNHGGIETLTETIASTISKHFKVQIITHPASNQKSLYKTFTTVLPYPQTDPANNAIRYLRPSIIDHILLIPLLFRGIPKIGKPVWIYDLLYVFYRMVFYSRLKKLLISPQKTSLVHCFSTGYLARCVSEACLELGIPLVHSPFIHFGRWGDSPAQLSAYSKADIITFPTDHLKQGYLSKLQTPVNGRIEVIPPLCQDPICTDSEIPISEDFILFLGRREKHKGLPVLIDALDHMKCILPLVIAGPGAAVESKNPHITDLGAVDERTKNALLKRCTLLCVPSTDETFGIIYTEAMSYGKPVVALDISPVNEIIENGVSGILVPSGDVLALAEAVDRIVSDQKLREKMGREGIKRYNEKFSNDRITKRYLNVYTNLF